MKCEICGGGCAADSFPKVNRLTRINQKGVAGIWRCDEHLSGFVRVDHNRQLERELYDETKAIFVHAPGCSGCCDYACNPSGFEQAEKSVKIKNINLE